MQNSRYLFQVMISIKLPKKSVMVIMMFKSKIITISPMA